MENNLVCRPVVIAKKVKGHKNVPEVRATLPITLVLPARLIDDAVLPDQVDVVVKYPGVRRVQLVGKGEGLVVILSGQSNDFALGESFIRSVGNADEDT